MLKYCLRITSFAFQTLHIPIKSLSSAPHPSFSILFLNTVLDDVLNDPTYQNKVIKALKLGYTEQLLQQAVLKLGRKAGEDQILEELIRLQKTVAKSEESNNVVLTADHVLVNPNDLKNNPRPDNLKDDKSVAEGIITIYIYPQLVCLKPNLSPDKKNS